MSQRNAETTAAAAKAAAAEAGSLTDCLLSFQIESKQERSCLTCNSMCVCAVCVYLCMLLACLLKFL